MLLVPACWRGMDLEAAGLLYRGAVDTRSTRPASIGLWDTHGIRYISITVWWMSGDGIHIGIRSTKWAEYGWCFHRSFFSSSKYTLLPSMYAGHQAMLGASGFSISPPRIDPKTGEICEFSHLVISMLAGLRYFSNTPSLSSSIDRITSLDACLYFTTTPCLPRIRTLTFDSALCSSNE